LALAGGFAGLLAKAGIGRPVNAAIAVASALRIMNDRRSDPSGGSVKSRTGMGFRDLSTSWADILHPLQTITVVAQRPLAKRL